MSKRINHIVYYRPDSIVCKEATRKITLTLTGNTPIDKAYMTAKGGFIGKSEFFVRSLNASTIDV